MPLRLTYLSISLLSGLVTLSAQTVDSLATDTLNSIQLESVLEQDSTVIPDDVILLEDTLLINDTLSLSDVTDSLEDSIQWHITEDYMKSLIIPSYEELLKLYYDATVEVDKHINDNAYRLQPDNYQYVNPFIFDNIVVLQNQLPNLNDYKTGFGNSSPFDKNAHDIYMEMNDYIANNYPQLASRTWRQMPEPPKTKEKVTGIDYSHINFERQHFSITGPQKINKVEEKYVPWNVGVTSTLTVTQTAYSNWASGGNNSLTIAGKLTSNADYTCKDKKVVWENDLDLRLGYIWQQDKRFAKNLDLFDITSKFSLNAINKWYYALSSEFKSQFFNGYDINNDNYTDPVSAFLSPAYLKVSAGIDYKYTYKKNKILSVQGSPLSLKSTFVRDSANVNPAKYSIEDGKRWRHEIGGSVKISSKYAYKKIFSGSSTLQFFSNYVEKPQNIDVDWNTSLTYNLGSVFTISITYDLVYDDDVDILLNEAEDGTKTYGQRIQMKEYFGFGLTYRLL